MAELKDCYLTRACQQQVQRRYVLQNRFDDIIEGMKDRLEKEMRECMLKLPLLRLIISVLIVSLIGSNFVSSAQASQLPYDPKYSNILQPTVPDQAHLISGFSIIGSGPNSLVLDIQLPSYRIESALIRVNHATFYLSMDTLLLHYLVNRVCYRQVSWLASHPK